jgi:hypothetical protein
VAEDLDAVGGEPILDAGSSVNRGIVLMEKPPLLQQDRPLLPQMHYEDIQDLDNVGRVDSGAPGDDVRVDEALAVKEGQQHLFGPARLTLAFIGPGSPFFIYCWDCFFILRV